MSPEADRSTVRCPRCQRRAVYDSSNPYRPFCSKRCKLVDLGAWASEEYAIPGEPADPAQRPGDAPAPRPGDDED